MKQGLYAIVVLLFLSFSACSSRSGDKDQTAADTSVTPAIETTRSGWYYLSEQGIHSVSSPAVIPAREFTPWTESPRVSDMAVINGRPSFLINRIGVMSGSANGLQSALHAHPEQFSSVTAAGFIQTNGKTGIRVYTNSFFAAPQGVGPQDVFLLYYAPVSGMVTPWLTVQEMGLDPLNQCVALDQVGSMWYASFKKESNEKITFTYLEFDSFPLAATSRKIDADSYRRAVSPFPFSGIPEGIKTLLSSIPESTPLLLSVYSPTRMGVQYWAREGEGAPLEGKAVTYQDQSAVLFPDGTLYLAADGMSQSGKTLRLPRLAEGYIYTYFMISGSKLVAAWEERRFFETGRAGLLEIPLPDGIYWKEE
ncbi:MAG: hypothetical protein JW875_01000 [Spirochaetales bacterium]|nr:hypothetical protein [Spirochaetales bacterium]